MEQEYRINILIRIKSKNTNSNQNMFLFETIISNQTFLWQIINCYDESNLGRDFIFKLLPLKYIIDITQAWYNDYGFEKENKIVIDHWNDMPEPIKILFKDFLNGMNEINTLEHNNMIKYKFKCSDKNIPIRFITKFEDIIGVPVYNKENLLIEPFW